MIIEVSQLCKSFDGVKALDGLNLSVPRGAVYGLVGPNGAGKSTAIRHIVGIYRQDSGKVLVDGQPVFENPQVKSRLAYIPDDIFYFTQSSTSDLMRFYRSVYPSFDQAHFQKLGKLIQIDPKRPIRKLSKGMQKQAAFWLALSLRPNLMVLDEPVDGLDPVMRRQVWSLMLDEVSQSGTSILVSSHNLRELEDVCDHVGIMNHGRTIVERGLSELQDNIVKIQLALKDGAQLPQGLEILHQSSTGRLQQLILRGRAEDLTQRLSAAQPLFMDLVPLSLEEIFIYELGGANDEVKGLI